MTIVGIAMNLMLASLLGAALVMGWRLNRRLKGLRASQADFAIAVRELNLAAARAEQGLADLRAASDEAVDMLADRIDKGRQLAARLERLTQNAPAIAKLADAEDDRAQERRLGALLAAAREARARPERLVRSEPEAPVPAASRAGGLAASLQARPRPAFEDDLFDEPVDLTPQRGLRR